MSSLDMSLALENFAAASPRQQPVEALRLVLLPGELIRVPTGRRAITILSGRAWLSFDGKDYDLAEGDRLEIKASKHPALISEMAGERLLFEVR